MRSITRQPNSPKGAIIVRYPELTAYFGETHVYLAFNADRPLIWEDVYDALYTHRIDIELMGCRTFRHVVKAEYR